MSVPAGSITGLVGPNGAGKTTLLLMLAALLRPDSGTIRVAGLDPVTQPREVHLAVGWMPDAFGTWDSLTCTEILSTFAAAQGLAWLPTLSIILLVYVFSHYAFASLSAHISALYAPLLAVAVAAGAPAALAAILLAVFSNLCGSLTHYSSGPAPIFFGAGYIDQPTWWKFGFIITVVNLVIWSVVGGVWWKILGLW